MTTQRFIKMIGLMFTAGTTVNCMGAGDGGPATCKDAKAQYGVQADGPQTLYLGGDKTMPWPAYCVGMATPDPVEYLALPQYSAGGQAANYSEFRELDRDPDPAKNVDVSIKTHYDKVRFDPETLTIDVTDQAFVHSESPLDPTARISKVLGSLSIGYMPFGAAMECNDPPTDAAGVKTAARANIDLTGLPFQLSDQQLCADPGGSVYVKDPTSPTKIVTFLAQGVSGSCGKASVRCLPNPTVNGAVGGQTVIPVRYEGNVPGLGF